MRKIFTLFGVAFVILSASAFNEPTVLSSQLESQRIFKSYLPEKKGSSDKIIKSFKGNTLNRIVTRASEESIIGKSYITLYNDGDNSCNSYFTVEAGEGGSIKLKGIIEGYDANATYDASTGKITIPTGVVIGTYSTYGNITLYSLSSDGLYSTHDVIITINDDNTLSFSEGLYAAVTAGGLAVMLDPSGVESNGTFTVTTTASSTSPSTSVEAPVYVTKTGEDTIEIVGINVALNGIMFTNGKPYGVNCHNTFTLDEDNMTATAPFEPYDNYGSYGGFYYGMIVGGYLDDLVLNGKVNDNVSTFTTSNSTFYGYLNGSSYSGASGLTPVLTINMDVFTAEVEEAPDPNEGWEDLGMAKFMDGWVLPCFGINQLDEKNWYEVPLQRSLTNENIYRLVDPYHLGPAVDFNESKVTGYIMFDVSDSDHVVFLKSNAGWANSEVGVSTFYCYNSLAFYMNYLDASSEDIIQAFGDEIPNTTFKNNVVSLGYYDDPEYGIQYDANFGFQGDPDGGFSWQDNSGETVNMTAAIYFPGYSSITNLSNSDYKIEYYNLQGVKVVNPEKGQIVIKKQGDSVSKVIVR